MLDEIARARRSSASLEDACARHGSASRRWAETADEARAQWDDAAGRALQQRWLEPYRPLIDGLYRRAQTAVEGQRTALDSAGRAVDAATRAADAVTRATSALRQAHVHGAAAQAEISITVSEAASTRQLSAYVAERISSLG
ncbi:MAG: hypothetical protein H7099_19155 [Gemmatimonadaceae bacterium]|nr:hypothetical protein [Gemmatimonadaceae bacterium]